MRGKPDSKAQFSCDSMLGRLCRELRMHGVDVDYARGMGGMRAYQRARSRQRTLLTRNTKLRELEGAYFIQSAEPAAQLGEVNREFELGLTLKPETADAFSRCMECNGTLERISRDQARPSVPFFIYQIHHEFKRCPGCGRVYWPGSHKQSMTGQKPDSGRPSRPGHGGPGHRQPAPAAGSGPARKDDDRQQQPRPERGGRSGRRRQRPGGRRRGGQGRHRRPKPGGPAGKPEQQDRTPDRQKLEEK